MLKFIQAMVLFGLLCGLIVFGLGFEIRRFAEVDQTRQADAAIVLGAAVVRGRPSSVLRERINHAVDLYHAGVVDTLIFTGGVGSRDSVSESSVSRDYAISRGVDPNDILIEETSTNTIENLTNAYAVAQSAEIDSYLIVSTPYHMRRAVWIARDLGMDAYSSPTRTIRWRSDSTRRAALVQETISMSVHLVRRPFVFGVLRVFNSPI